MQNNSGMNQMKSCRRDVAVRAPTSVYGTGDTQIRIMEDKCAAGKHLLPSLPVTVLETEAIMAPNEMEIESTDLNIKQGHLMLDVSNVSTPIMPSAHSPQQDKGKENCQIQERLPLHSESANDSNTTLKGCKEDFSSRLKITSPSKVNKLTNNTDDELQNLYKIRCKTPPMAIPVTDIFSPNTVNEVRSTIRALFPNGPPPAQPVIPVKKYKKADTPYIVGCTKRRRVPESKSLNVFKGDNYGITDETNSVDNEECPLKRKRGKRNQYANWSKSRFNPKTDEIAARLKSYENVNTTSLKSPNTNDSVSCKPQTHTPRQQAFSPLPSTSKDNETIMKNEIQFSESLRYQDLAACDDDDDDELPDIVWDSKTMNKKKNHCSLLQSKAIELISNEEPSVKNEDLNNNNNNCSDEIDLREIEFDKYMPKKEYPIPMLTTGNDPIVIDEIDLDNFNEAREPKRVLGEIQKVNETHEIEDDYSSITNEDLYPNPVPKSTEPIDVDELFKDLKNFQQRKRKFSHNIITIVDPAEVETSRFKKPRTNPVPQQEPLVAIETKPNAVETAKFVEILDSIEPNNSSNHPSFHTPISQPAANDVEFVSEIIVGENEYNTTRDNSTNTNLITPPTNNSANNNPLNITSDPEPHSRTWRTQYLGGFLRNYDNLHPSGELDELHLLYQFLTDIDQHANSSQSRSRSKKPKKSTPKEQPQQSVTVNNENAAPSMNGQDMTPTNGERRLGDCPICMDHLVRGSIASTTCGHVFCLECIKKCVRTSGKKCPTCRKTLKGPGYHSIFL